MTEAHIYKAFARYMGIAHPRVLYRFDYGAGTYLSWKQSLEQKSINPHSGYPDLFIAKPCGKYYGAFFEIKKAGADPYLKRGAKRGMLKDNAHIQEQAAMLDRLRKYGYYAEFAVGLDELIELTEGYLKQNI
jgi:hypothetical protein